MARTRVKICGLTRNQDALSAAMSGADAVGLVFYPPSSRAVSVAQAPVVTANLPAFVTVVGLLVNPAEQEVVSVLETSVVDCLQFHGDESVEFCESFGVPYIKAIRVNELADARIKLQQFAGRCTVILDTYTKNSAGGTGQAFDWSIAKALVAEFQNQIVLAGGLNPGNVNAAISMVRPYGVDVSSGVELSPGIKDPEKMRKFFSVVHDAGQNKV
ncbi:MAG: phosphoribosylanthranilate isomerase [Gammaproteobacteria bacterium]|nr:phosphoribosylanthranilate isomerase [Gammaproteobacteria bacterium]